MTAGAKTITVLTSRSDTLDFLSHHPDPDEVIRWTCPECKAVNDHTYHHGIARCASCGRGHFPAIPLPIVGDAKTTVRRAFMNDRLSQIDRNIDEANGRIREAEGEIDDQNRYIRQLEKERDDLKYALHLDMVNAGDA